MSTNFNLGRRLSRRAGVALAFLALLAANLAGASEAESSANPTSPLPPLRTQPPYGVRSVRREGQPANSTAPCRAGVNDYLSLEAVNFVGWNNVVQTKKAKDDLVLFLGGEALPGLHPKFFTEWEEPAWDAGSGRYKTNRISSYGVRLEQNADNHEVWKRLVRSPGFEFERPMEVSMGFEDAPPMTTWVYPLPGVAKSPFFLIILSRTNLYLGLVVIIGAFLIFVMLARKTDILRDPNLPLRPDESRPFSLARAQMAFWFFLVIGSYFFLWLLSGDTGTLNSSTIALIGISAGTAVSSAFIDAGKRRDLYENVVAKEVRTKKPEDLLAELGSSLRQTEEELTELRKTREALETKDGSALAANERQTIALNRKKRMLEYQMEFFQAPLWKAAMQDMLGDNGAVSFHRFQMCVWTIVLGIIFVTDVYSKMAMPEFSASLLGLMGVSAGTFIGFKIPEQAKT